MNDAPQEKRHYLAQTARAFASHWIGKVVLAGPVLLAACFLTAAWWEVGPTVRVVFRSLMATAEAPATQRSLVWAVVPGRDFRAEPDDPSLPRAPRLRLELTLGFDTADGVSGTLLLTGPDRGMWAEADRFLRPLFHVGHAARLTLPITLHVPTEYLAELEKATSSYLLVPDGANEIDGIFAQLDQPLEVLAFSWWLAEAKTVSVSHQPGHPDRALLDGLSLRRIVAVVLMTALMTLFALVFLSPALLFLAPNLSRRVKGALVVALLLTVPWWTPWLGRIAPWLGADSALALRASGVVASEPTPDWITPAPVPTSNEHEVLTWDLSDSYYAELLEFLALERAGRQFESFEEAYATILDDITARLASANDEELQPFLRRVRALGRVNRPALTEALLEGVDQLARDEARSESIRQLAEKVLLDIALRLHYSYYTLAANARLEKLRPFTEHTNSRIRDSIREDVEWLQSPRGAGAGY